QLISEGVVDEKYGQDLRAALEEELEEELEASKNLDKSFVMHFLEETWKDYVSPETGSWQDSPKTGVTKKKLNALADKISTLPEGKKFYRKAKKLIADRAKMIKEDRLDWGMGETLAYASLLEEGHPVRISGQDVERGTFSHRHAVIKTEDTEEEIIPLNLLSDKQAKLSIFNSLLSEYGVLGFDYGYAFGAPDGLTIWEAQFGDFNNGAQIIIDQFISAAEDKWRTQNGLVMFLPHGYEGMGSEHSSGRMERYLQLCAEDNIQVVNITTPANFFHLLRRQVKRSYRKPLVVFTPKKLLRYPKAVSSLDELTKGGFQEVLLDPHVNAKDVDTVVLCSGKVYYDILEEKEAQKTGENIAVVRLEQLYPLPEKQIHDLLKKYKAENVIWMQEEPENMGAWSYILRSMKDLDIEVIARPASGSPAAGSPRIHEQRLKTLMDQLFAFAKVNA
ncbi:MAG: 2-oxoglutarate dehydrogenase E1 component, partial [Bacteroidota bacterium]